MNLDEARWTSRNGNPIKLRTSLPSPRKAAENGAKTGDRRGPTCLLQKRQLLECTQGQTRAGIIQERLSAKNKEC